MRKITGFLLILFLMAGCQAPREPRVILGGHEFKVEVAKTQASRESGLSNRLKLEQNTGMLFVFKKKGIQKFWMKNMIFPLDIIWLDHDRIVKIDKNLPPEGERPQNIYESGIAIDKVLEITAGQSDELKLNVGDIIIYDY